MTTANRRRSFPALTPLRADRLRRALTLAELARASGLSSFRLSIIERGLDDATPDELARLQRALESLAPSQDDPR
jgi:transcriptional regulator with XRE-family HTH domain